MLLTYTDNPDGPRAEYAYETLRTTLENLQYSGQVSVHIADDGSPDAHRASLYAIAGGFESVHGITQTDAKRGGYGASYNLATQVVHQHAGPNGIVLPLEDDWRLAHKFNADPYVAALALGQVGCIRLGYIGYTQELGGSLSRIGDEMFLVFDPDSPERHVCSGHPRLETVAWERRVGVWPQGVDPGTTEHLWCGFRAAREGVAWPMDTPRGGWYHHIGAVQARSDQG